jgi:hypothetical protein
MASGAYNALWQSMVPTRCLDAHKTDPGACLLPQLSYSYVASPLFIVVAQSDRVVLEYHNNVPLLTKASLPLAPSLSTYMTAYASNQTHDLQLAMKTSSPNGVFNPACFVHTEFQKHIKINGENYLTAFLKWFQGAEVKLAEVCDGTKPVLCNPTCVLKST